MEEWTRSRARDMSSCVIEAREALEDKMAVEEVDEEEG
jgi:hypothetical protein